ncbi:FAD-binding domain-containing protein [Tychonema sp. BBK16]|uniref:FAD-binding domain-containing protein n=1 Tax=Tychonema sp. BBK16 TaxID=2699888 RepID=UPI001F1A5E1D|nr:FAD-binding domain-containing protein [Tychonema sp. BBK16]MCF6375407.1 deoxyribodipyrimidine photo-lyase [Tychonema sp. BBK16]
MSDLILFWHRRDLRICDNIGLGAARQQSQKVVGIFCLDRNLLDLDDVAPARVAYMIGCLQKLQQSYAESGSQLLIIQDEPSQGIPRLATAINAKAVFWNWDVEPYAKKRDLAVSNALQQAGITIQNFWDQLLHAPDEIRTGTGTIYTVYTPFWKRWNSKPKTQPVETLPVISLELMVGLTSEEQEIANQAGAIQVLPSARDLGFVWEGSLLIEPGEDAAREKLEEFCDRAIYEYQEKRNFPIVNGTSQLSPALKFGAIGIRTVWQATQIVMDNCRNEETRANIRTWQQELAWREFYQHAMYNFPELADGPYRQAFKDFPWDNDQKLFQAWCRGKTGYPIVDAAMRQLNQTGWMHNRCRMIVASFLTKDLIINWQWGEKYFMQKLIDGDLSANNGGWQWSASSGMDPKPLRIFNPSTQAQKFDPEGEYIRHWVPELRRVDTKLLLTGNIPPLVRRTLPYPDPIVDHNEQQRKFKELYKQQKIVE